MSTANLVGEMIKDWNDLGLRYAGLNEEEPLPGLDLDLWKDFKSLVGGGGNIDYNYTVEVPSKSRANIFSWVELKSFHNEESPAKVFSWIQH